MQTGVYINAVNESLYPWLLFLFSAGKEAASFVDQDGHFFCMPLEQAQQFKFSELQMNECEFKRAPVASVSWEAWDAEYQALRLGDECS